METSFSFKGRGIVLLLIALFIGLSLSFGGQNSLSAQQQTDFITYYPTASDEFFTNPGIGWQRMEHNNPPLLEEAVTYPTREEISWRVLNPGPGQYDWTVLEEKMQRATDNGQLFSFRIYTMQGESYGGHKVPQWVVNRDSRIIRGGSPDYSNCNYQNFWAVFVDALRLRYDGDPRISFIDISGYGDFNEWSWLDGQTVWDNNFADPESVDGQARVRLADMFIGGTDDSHTCTGSNGQQQTTSYSYVGFQETQLVMPFAGVQQTTRYVASRRDDVGIRYDCLGRDSRLDRIEDVIEDTWRTAPIIFEFCANSTTRSDVMNRAYTLMNASHGVIVHENLENPRDEAPVRNFMTNVGYRYQLTQAVYDSAVESGGVLSLSMGWQNVGTSPAYPSMGYDFELHIYLLASNGDAIVDHASSHVVTDWMPAHPYPGEAPVNAVGEEMSIPSNLEDGMYELRVAIVNTANNEAINLAFTGGDQQNRYLIGEVRVGDGVSNLPAPPPLQPTATITPTIVPTVEPTEEPTAPAIVVVSTQVGVTETPVPPTQSSVVVQATQVVTNPNGSGSTTGVGTGSIIVIPPSNTSGSNSSGNGNGSNSSGNGNGSNSSGNGNGSNSSGNGNGSNSSGNGNGNGGGRGNGSGGNPNNGNRAGGPGTLHVSTLDASTWGDSRSWTAFVEVIVQSPGEWGVRGVTVTARWHDGTITTCVTGGEGYCDMRLPNISTSRNTATMTITNLSRSGYSYYPADNYDPQQGRGNNRDSDGTTIVVRRR